jgi:hypothetical protein
LRRRREGDLSVDLDLVELDAEHLASDEVRNVDVLSSWRRHCGGGGGGGGDDDGNSKVDEDDSSDRVSDGMT